MNKTKAAEVARNIRAACKEHGMIDVYSDRAGNFYTLPADAEHVGRYSEAVPPAWVVGDLMEGASHE